MMKHPRLLVLISIHLLICLPAVLLLVAATDVQPAHRPGCKSRCGNVDIPYPFGIGDECSLSPVFQMNCTNVNGTYKPFQGPFEVTKISVPNAKAWMKIPISWRCSTPAHQVVWYQDFTGTAFRFSDVDNKIFVMGCNTLAYMKSPPVSYHLSHYIYPFILSPNKIIAEFIPQTILVESTYPLWFFSLHIQFKLNIIYNCGGGREYIYKPYFFLKLHFEFPSLFSMEFCISRIKIV